MSDGTLGAEPKLRERAGRLRAWLRDAAWPLWLAHGVDWRRGAFHETLDLATRTCPSTYRRLRVCARQVYVFAQAHRDGLARADEAVALGVAFLRGPAADPDGGYWMRFDLENRPTDRTRDLYDLAFVLFAFAAAAPVLGREAMRREAHGVLDFVRTRMAHPADGYVESLPVTDTPRRQNPHMHLLEAVLAAHEAFGDPVFLETATSLIGLFLDRLFDPRLGALPEYFDEALRPRSEGGRYLVEPGHHCEWAWLLDWYARTAAGSGLPVRPGLAEASAALLGFVDRHGLDPATGVARDELWSDGSVRAGSARIWPQTERLKSEVLRPDRDPARAAAAFAALEAYLRPDGLWNERRDAAGRLSDEPAPASSLYHITAGILFAHARLAGG